MSCDPGSLSLGMISEPYRGLHPQTLEPPCHGLGTEAPEPCHGLRRQIIERCHLLCHWIPDPCHHFCALPRVLILEPLSLAITFEPCRGPRPQTLSVGVTFDEYGDWLRTEAIEHCNDSGALPWIAHPDH